MIGLKHYPWTTLDVQKARTIWQRAIADRYGEDDIPLGAQRRAFELIAAEIRRTVDAVNGRYQQFGASFAAGSRRGEASRQAELERAHLLEARQARTLTATIFGDPPPGYSALDKRRGEGAAR